MNHARQDAGEDEDEGESEDEGGGGAGDEAAGQGADNLRSRLAI